MENYGRVLVYFDYLILEIHESTYPLPFRLYMHISVSYVATRFESTAVNTFYLFGKFNLCPIHFLCVLHGEESIQECVAKISTCYRDLT